MGNVVEMNPVHVLDEKMKAKVLEAGKCIQNRWGKVRKMSMEIGWYGAFIESHAEEGSWGVLGYKDQHAFRIAVGIGRSNWYRLLAIAKNFVELDRESFMTMSIENAERLGMEPTEMRYKPEHIKDAAEMQAREFDDKLTTIGAHNEGRPKSEQWVHIRWKLQKSQRDAIEENLKGWAQEQGISYTEDSGYYALELLLADARQRPSMIGFMLESKEELAEAIKKAEDISELKLQIANYLIKMGNIINTCCGEVEEVA